MPLRTSRRKVPSRSEGNYRALGAFGRRVVDHHPVAAASLRLVERPVGSGTPLGTAFARMPISHPDRKREPIYHLGWLRMTSEWDAKSPHRRTTIPGVYLLFRDHGLRAAQPPLNGLQIPKRSRHAPCPTTRGFLLWRLADDGPSRGCAGTGAGAVIGDKKTGDLWLENPHSIVMRLKAKQAGVTLSLGVDALSSRWSGNAPECVLVCLQRKTSFVFH